MFIWATAMGFLSPPALEVLRLLVRLRLASRPSMFPRDQAHAWRWRRRQTWVPRSAVTAFDDALGAFPATRKTTGMSSRPVPPCGCCMRTRACTAPRCDLSSQRPKKMPRRTNTRRKPQVLACSYCSAQRIACLWAGRTSASTLINCIDPAFKRGRDSGWENRGTVQLAPDVADADDGGGGHECCTRRMGQHCS